MKYSANKREWSTDLCYNMNVKNMLSKRRQTLIVWLNLHELSRKGKYVEKENRLIVAWLRKWGLPENEYEGSNWVNEIRLDDGCTSWQIYAKSFNCTLRMGEFNEYIIVWLLLYEPRERQNWSMALAAGNWCPTSRVGVQWVERSGRELSEGLKFSVSTATSVLVSLCPLIIRDPSRKLENQFQPDVQLRPGWGPPGDC